MFKDLLKIAMKIAWNLYIFHYGFRFAQYVNHRLFSRVILRKLRIIKFKLHIFKCEIVYLYSSLLGKLL